jgi:hypothetical protein
MAKGQALGFKPAPPLEQVDDEHAKRKQAASIDPNHTMILPRDTNPKPDRIFGKDTGGAILRHMKVEEIAEVVAKLPPDQLARFRRWFTAFEAGRSDHAEELDSTATKLGRLAGRAVAELKKRAKEP